MNSIFFKNKWYITLSQLYTDIIYFTHEFYKNLNISPVPVSTTCDLVSSPSAKGSDSVPIKIEIFNKYTNLSDSMQFQLEYMLRFYKYGVYSVAQTFRGEQEDKRHLNQFLHSEAEIKGNLYDIMILVEKYLTFLTTKIVEHRKVILTDMGIDLKHLKLFLDFKEIPKISHNEALKLLEKNPECFSVSSNKKIISHIGEQKLIEYFSGAVWITHFPTLTVPFYQAFNNKGNTSLCADLLFGIGEVVGCGQRHKSYEHINRALDLYGIKNREKYQWYIDMKEITPIETSGFGMGVERYLLWLLNHQDIRDMNMMNNLHN